MLLVRVFYSIALLNMLQIGQEVNQNLHIIKINPCENVN